MDQSLRTVRQLQAVPWPWPLPALAVWAAAWGSHLGARAVGVPMGWSLVLAVLLGTALAWPLATRWRRGLAALGFPLSVALSGGLPAWLWLVAVVPLVLAYPVRSWRDAPFFPTPARALSGLPALAPLPFGARVLDAGCGLGHALDALRAAYPQARLEGIEWSRPLAAIAAWRCRSAAVRRGDMWQASWAGYAMVYLFQRPERMARAWRKACDDMTPGHWFVSLEFAVPGVAPVVRLDAGRLAVWVYRIPHTSGPGPQSPDAPADNPPMPRG